MGGIDQLFEARFVDLFTAQCQRVSGRMRKWSSRIHVHFDRESGHSICIYIYDRDDRTYCTPTSANIYEPSVIIPMAPMAKTQLMPREITEYILPAKRTNDIVNSIYILFCILS